MGPGGPRRMEVRPRTGKGAAWGLSIRVGGAVGASLLPKPCCAEMPVQVQLPRSGPGVRAAGGGRLWHKRTVPPPGCALRGESWYLG